MRGGGEAARHDAAQQRDQRAARRAAMRGGVEAAWHDAVRPQPAEKGGLRHDAAHPQPREEGMRHDAMHPQPAEEGGLHLLACLCQLLLKLLPLLLFRALVWLAILLPTVLATPVGCFRLVRGLLWQTLHLIELMACLDLWDMIVNVFRYPFFSTAWLVPEVARAEAFERLTFSRWCFWYMSLSLPLFALLQLAATPWSCFWLVHSLLWLACQPSELRLWRALDATVEQDSRARPLGSTLVWVSFALLPALLVLPRTLRFLSAPFLVAA